MQPRHGTFPELVEATGGGILVEPDDNADLAVGLRRMLEDHALREETGRAGEAAVRERFTAGSMARGVISVLEQAARVATLPT
jgi:glycosyltransferase involved in cell wall biosynthesis